MIYVDHFAMPVSDKWKGGGHLLTSDLDELHRFAMMLGLRRSWFQNTTFPHYDLTRNKRLAAIGNGATVIGPGHFPDDLLVKKSDGNYERYDQRLKRLTGGKS